jgi:hypothetical protein
MRRAIRLGLGGVVAAALLAGCGEQKPNEARAPNPVQTTVKVTDSRVVVSPDTFDVKNASSVAQEESAPQAEAKQQGEKITTPVQTQPPTTADQPVVLTVINLSNQQMNLEVKGRGADALSGDIPAGGTGLLKVTLGTGTYKVLARGDFRPAAAKLRIGPLRASAQGDLLLP